MTTSDYPGSPPVTGTPTDSGSTSGGDKKEQAKQAAGTAADEGKHVAGVAKGEAQQVAAEAKDQVRNVMGEARTQVEEQSRTQRDRLVNTLRTFSDDLEQMASQGGRSGMATDVARQVAERTRDLSTRLDGREPADILDDVRSFARRKPGMFLFGAVAAGVAAGRLSRGAKDAQSNERSGDAYDRNAGHGVYGAPPPAVSGPYDDPAGTAAGDPTAGTGYPNAPVTPAAPPADPWVDDPAARRPM
jgi:hypothetical protein